MKIRSYSSIYNLGHRELLGFLDNEVTVEEKIDGSQFSFMKDHDGNLYARSKGQDLDVNITEHMFAKALATVREIGELLTPGYTYRGEYLQKPKHNTLAYDRIPNKHIMIYDIDKADQDYLTYEEKLKECERIGLEAVPHFYTGKLETFDKLMDLLETVSCLGGQKIEGIVIKNYNRFGGDKKTLMAKHVSEAFKELHSGDWKARHPAGADIKQSIVLALRTPARWHKAVQHLRDQELITDTPKDIGLLMKEVAIDIEKECVDLIKEQLFKWAWKDIHRGVVHGLPEWYKEELAKKQFEVQS